MAEMSLTPSANVTKVGSIIVIFLIAILAVWMVNNIEYFGKLTAKRTTT